MDTKGEVMNYVGIDIGSTASKVVTRGDCQMTGRLKSICKFKEEQVADTSV